MGKNRKQASLTNVVQYDSNFNLSIGTSTSSSFNSSGSIIAASGFTGSLSGSVFGLGNTVSFSSSVSSDLINLESKSASVDISITNINSVTASNIARLSNLESKSSSVDISVSSLNTFSASNDNTSLNSKTGSYATTGSNSFYGTQVFSGSVYIANDLVVQGSSSIQYISASSVSIGTNIVQLNTATPSVRYAGISVQDSGSSAGVTGSMLWDSLCNRWIYSNPSTIGYSGGILMSGPRAATFGTETTLTCNYIAKSGGGDHLYDSCIWEMSGSVGIGTVSPLGLLQIGGADSAGTLYVTASANQNAARLRNNNSSYATLDICNLSSTGYGIYASANKHYFSGSIGIGTLNPDKKLHISGSGANGGITFDVDTVNTIIRGNTTSNFDLNNEGNGGCIRLYGSAIQFRTNVADPAVVINNAGCVGINYTTPSGRLTVGGDNNQIHLRGGYYASIYGFSGDTNVYGLYSSCAATYLNARSGDGLYLGGSISVAGGNHLFIDTNGVSCFYGTICPKSGVKFNNGNCVLNYYEEGKWCVYACGSSSGAGPVGEGSYTRLGRLVTASIVINSQTFPSYSGVLRLSLPFTAGSGSGLGGNMTWQAGGVYFYPFSAWCSGTNFTGLDATVFNSTNYVVFAIGNVNGDRQGSVSSTTTATSGAGGLYLRFTVTYEVSQ
jgi:hypothetical protein